MNKQWKIPFFKLELSKNEKDAVKNVMASNWITSGPKTEEFEKKFCRLFSKNINGVALSSATAALHLALNLLKIKKNDEVILPSLTFVSCANVIKYIGAKPIFADITSLENWNISVQDIKEKITSKTKAIMVVHYSGYPCDMAEIKYLADKYNLFIIEDCSHAPLAKHNLGYVGTLGDVGCFSFFTNKNITTGEGGMLITKNVNMASRAKNLRSHGLTKSTFERYKLGMPDYDVSEIGYNYRMDDIRASIGIEQLKKIRVFNEKRKKATEFYIEQITKKIPQIIIPFKNKIYKSSYHIFPILLPSTIKSRNDLIIKMHDRGIQCSIHYKPIHKFRVYSNLKVKLPITDKIEKNILTLPLYPSISKDAIRYVIDNLNEVLTN